MKAFFKLSLILSVLVSVGCAQLVKRTYEPVRGGTVKYSTSWPLGDKNREKAMEEMKSYCGNQRARIVSERSEIELNGDSRSTSRRDGNITHSETRSNKESVAYMDFKCVSSKRVAKK